MAAPVKKSMEMLSCQSHCNNRFVLPHSEADEWLFRSIKRYTNLFMYELQSPTQVIEWIGETSICVGCQHSNEKTELLELLLPADLSKPESNDTASSLRKERDFRVNSGGFHDRHISSLKQLGNKRYVVTGEKGENCVRIWALGDGGSGFIEKKSTINNVEQDNRASAVAVNSWTSDTLAFGTRVSNICITDSNTSVISYNTRACSQRQQIVDLKYLDQTTLMTCGLNSGDLWIFDPREKPTSAKSYGIQKHEEHLDRWTFDLISTSDIAKVVRVNSHGNVIISDVRNLQDSVIETKIAAPLVKHDYLNVKWSTRPDVFSVSGGDGNVYIYSTITGIEKETRMDQIDPLFTHIGHTAESSDSIDDILVWTHTWHPRIKQLMLSAASDGSLHAWEYVNT